MAEQARVEIRNIVLNVNDQQTIRIQMKVGQVDATVNVVDSAAITRESPAVSTVVDRQIVENLPLNGRRSSDKRCGSTARARL